MLLTKEDEKIIMEAEEVWGTHVERQRMIELALHIFRGNTMDRRIEAMAGSRVVSSLVTANQEDDKGKKTPVYWAVEKVVALVVARGTVNKVIHMKFDSLAELQDIVQRLKLSFIENLSIIMPITLVIKKHAQAAVVDEAKIYDQGMDSANQDEVGTPPSHPTGMSSDPLHLSSNEEKKKPKKNKSPSFSSSQSRSNQRDENDDPTWTIPMTI